MALIFVLMYLLFLLRPNVIYCHALIMYYYARIEKKGVLVLATVILDLHL